MREEGKTGSCSKRDGMKGITECHVCREVPVLQSVAQGPMGRWASDEAGNGARTRLGIKE